MQSAPRFKKKATDQSPAESNGFVKVVAEHYNKRPKTELSQRQKSEIITLRSLNNWIKAVLIKESIKWIVGRDKGKGLCVLDFAGGKGGDLNKWAQSDVAEYVCADIASESIAEAKRRYDSRANQFRFHARFIVADCFGSRCGEWMPSGDLAFDIISCQFALHYAFATQDRAQSALSNVAAMLRPGGVFIGTIPNANRVVKRLREASASKSFGNTFYRITAKQLDPFARYGHEYTFHLNDAIDNLPEYLIHLPTLIDSCAKLGLELLYLREFPELVDEYCAVPEYAQLFLRNKVVTKHQPHISPEEWEISSMYLAFVFRKRAESTPPE